MPPHRPDATALLDTRGYTGALIRGANPAHLIEKAVRDRITESFYWKEQCFGLNAATLCDRAVELDCVGGTYGDQGRPTPFLCLAFKMLQIMPPREIVLEFLNFAEGDAEDEGDGHFKYLRVLAAFYIRLTWEPVDIYNTLGALLADPRKIRRRTRNGFSLTYVDQLVDEMLSKDRMFATSLWKMPVRSQLEDMDLLEAYVSPLQGEVDAMDDDDDDDRSLRSVGSGAVGSRSPSSSGSRSRSRSQSRPRSRPQSSPRSQSPV
ncbi:PRP38-domain-containing protein [Pseudovirgaria hyperparasitica]|uniref:Pre-mRNA-splicing factor 38 n=1 Tax=Pseudovirgaria hyperparasitica TaxID=470096 RepID=A0A6A6WM49_9PEZI|nr:PRP38-domain-containing protein [Pseudovirgaria hyperparasitica]KAF2763281.1 PRP38-domain-containing protein [Pseudovirgaria hyperparasitica]